MATTITSNYFAVTADRIAEAGGVFNIDVSSHAKSGVDTIEIAITEPTLAPSVIFNLPKIEEVSGQPWFSIIIKDSHLNIQPPTEVQIQPYVDPAGGPGIYADGIGTMEPGEPIALAESGKGVRLYWAADPNASTPINGFWGVSSQDMPSI